MICLTGDVHHSSLHTKDQDYLIGNEMEAAEKMACICRDYNINLTLFFTGLCAKESPGIIHRIASFPNVEIGGHNYYAFTPRQVYRSFKKIFGSINGPGWYQRWEVRRTVRILEKIGGQPIVSWRDHAYNHDKNTRKILQKEKILCFSDVLSGECEQPYWNQGILEVPINIMPDHDYVHHGWRQPGTFDEGKLRKGPFKTMPMDKTTWLNRIKQDVQYFESKGACSVLLTHPACMQIFDGFETFKKICIFLQQYNTAQMKELLR